VAPEDLAQQCHPPHRFEVDIAILDELHRWWAEDPDELEDSTDEDRVQFLLWFCSFLAGSIAGRMEAVTFMLHYDEGNASHNHAVNWSGEQRGI